MKILIIFLFIAYSFNVSAQTENIYIKLIPQTSLKIGSQTPKLGGQFDLVGGLLFQSKYFIGFGGGYASNMGMGGNTFPLYIDTKLYFSSNKILILASRDEVNNFLAEFQLGVLINNNLPYKTGFITSCGFAYRLDFIKLGKFRFPAFYLGPNFEYNYTKFIDEYRGYKIKDGYLKHIIFNLKIAFDINPIKL